MIPRFGTFFLLFAIASLLCTCGFWQELPDLSADELKKMIEENADLVIIDTRTQLEYARGRIPRSVFVPEEKFYALKLILPAAKDTPLVFYCRGFG